MVQTRERIAQSRIMPQEFQNSPSVRRNAVAYQDPIWTITKKERLKRRFERFKDGFFDQIEKCRQHVNQRTVKFIWMMICLTIFSFQAVHLTIQYSLYQQTSEVTIRNDEAFIPPSVTFCSSINNFFNISCLPNNHTCYKNPYGVCSIIYEHKINYVLENLTITPFNLLQYYHYVNGSFKTQAIGGPKFRNLIRILFKNRMKCFEINPNHFLDGPIEIAYFNEQDTVRRIFMKTEGFVQWFESMVNISQGTLKRIRSIRPVAPPPPPPLPLRPPLVNGETVPVTGLDAKIFLHPSNSTIYGYRVQPITLVVKKYLHIGFHEVFTELVKWPFTDCIDRKDIYESDGYESMDHCIEDCIRNLSITIYNISLPYMTYSHPVDTNIMIQPHPSGKNKTILERLTFNLEEKCEPKCRIDCSIQSYSIYELPDFHPHSNDFTMNIFYLNHVTGIKFSPKTTFIDLLIQVASLSSLWLGFVVFDSFVQLMKFIVKISEQRKQNKVSVILQNMNIQPQFFVYNN